MSITFAPYVQSGNGWTIQEDARLDPETFEVDCSNANAADLLLALGWDCDPANSEPLPIDAFANLVTAALRRHLDHRSPETEPVTVAEPGRMTLIHCGRRPGYIEERLSDLAQLTQRSRSTGATHIGWG